MSEMPEKIIKVIDKTLDKTAITSAPGKLNWRDQCVAWITSIIGTVAGLVIGAWSLIVLLLDSVADYALPYLQSVPQHDKPMWIAALTFVVMGLLILNKRRVSGPNYTPPMFTTPSNTETPAPQGRPLPPGTPVDTTKSAF